MSETTADQALDRPVLVTGATGFAGGHLARRLAGTGRTVRCLVRSGSSTAHLAHPKIELVEGDIRDREAVMRATRDTSLVYHIAAVYRTANHPDSYYREVNIEGTVNVLDAAAKFGVERTVHCSTVGVHGDVKEIPCTETSPFNPGDIYQETKLEGELKAQEAFAAGLPGSIFRPAGMYGPGDLRFLKLFRMIDKGRFVMIGSGETQYHTVYVDDLVDGIILCGERPEALGEVFIIAGDRWVTLNEWTAEIARALGKPRSRLKIPYAPIALASAACEAVCKPFGIDPPLHRRRAAFFVKHRAFSIEKAKSRLGYSPRIPIAEGVNRTVAWYISEGHLDGHRP